LQELKLDFCRTRPAPRWIAPVLLAVAAAFAGDVAFSYVKARREIAAKEAELAKLAPNMRATLECKRERSPLLVELRSNLQACGQVRLTVRFDDGSAQERARAFLFPASKEDLVVRAVEQLLEAIHWPAPVVALAVALEQIQDAVAEQMALFPLPDERENKLREVERYLAARFGANRLRRAVLVQPGAPLPEWRVGWHEGGGA